MRSLTLFLIPIIFLSSCTIDWNDEKDVKIAELENQIKNDFLKKKQECSKGYNDVIKEFESTDYNYSIDAIFYSPIKNSCLYATTITTVFNQWKTDSDTWNWFLIHDLYTHELIYTSSMIAINKVWLTKFYERENDYKKEIQELKWE